MSDVALITVILGMVGSHLADPLLDLSAVADIQVETDPVRLRPIHADLQVPDTSGFEAHTGWRPEIPFERTMGDLLDYRRERVARGHRSLRR